MNEAGVAPTY